MSSNSTLSSGLPAVLPQGWVQLQMWAAQLHVRCALQRACLKESIKTSKIEFQTTQHAETYETGADSSMYVSNISKNTTSVKTCATAPAGKTPGKLPSKARAGHAGTGSAEALKPMLDGDRNTIYKAPCMLVKHLYYSSDSQTQRSFFSTIGLLQLLYPAAVLQLTHAIRMHAHANAQLPTKTH
jgi:hypothetical protein